MSGLTHQGDEVPARVVCGRRLRSRIARLTLHCEPTIRQFHRVFDKQHADIAPYHIPDPGIRVEIHRKAANIPCGIGRCALAGHARESRADRRELAWLRKRCGPCKHRQSELVNPLARRVSTARSANSPVLSIPKTAV